VSIDRDGERRPAGAAFGLLVHAVLAEVPLEASPAIVEAMARAQGRAIGASGEEVARAAATAIRVLGHELLARARRATMRRRCHRETPIALAHSSGTLIEGVVDLAFEEDGRWIVVDFKTDADLSAHGGAYMRQVRLYADAIAAATGRPADAVVFQI
jgi:ATP-dependent helicase/nuclease subunit A